MDTVQTVMDLQDSYNMKNFWLTARLFASQKGLGAMRF